MQEKYKKLMKLSIIVIIVYLCFRFLLPLFFPFLLAYMIAWLLKRPVQFLKTKLKMKPMIGGVLFLFIILFGVGGGVVYGVRLLLKQFADLVMNYEYYETEWNSFLESICGYWDTFFRVQQGSTFSILSNSFDGILIFFQQEQRFFLPRVVVLSNLIFD